MEGSRQMKEQERAEIEQERKWKGVVKGWRSWKVRERKLGKQENEKE